MIIKNKEANKKVVGPMKISEYKINPNFSGSLVELNGEHQRIKCIREDRIYFIIDGEGEFEIAGKRTKVKSEDLVFVSKNTPYSMIGKMKYFLICSPEFNLKDDIIL